MNLIPRDSLFDMDKVFGEFFGNVPRVAEGSSNFFAPRVDVHEQDGKYVIDAELPGVDKDHIQVTLEKGVLTLEATLDEEEKQEEKGKVIRRERRYGRFQRSFYLGDNVAEEDIVASFTNGVLKLEIPKALPPEPEKRRIQVI